MDSGQNSNNDFRIKFTLSSIIILAEIFIIFLSYDLGWRYIIRIIFLVTMVNVAFIVFGVWQNSTKKRFIESQKNQMQERERLLTIINSLTDSILSVKPSGEIELFNSSALSLLDVKSKLSGQNIEKVLKLTDINGKKFNFRNIFRKGLPFFSANNLIFESGEDKIRIELEILSTQKFDLPTKNTKNKSFVVILRDITRQKTLDEERDEFISVVSHELRTPVAIAEGAVSNLRVMVDKEIPKNLLLKNVDITYKQVSFLATMVNDLSTLSRAERGVGDDFVRICPKQLGEGLFIKYQKQVEDKGLKLNLEIANGLREINTSKLYIEELLQNIITNSIKYTKEGDITISISPNSSKDAVCFAIRDTGIGISKSDQLKIFEKFYRSEDYRTRETGGTGLGLYISAKLAQKIGTKIKLKSRLNHGSIFSFEIPFVKD